MSPNQKKALAVFVLFLIVNLVAIACGHVVSALGGDKLASVVAGGGAWAVLMAIGVPLIALFEFKDDRASSQPLVVNNHRVQQMPPHGSGTSDA
ncbi:hypothetical protein [Streptomyces chartreusis]|uniref:hypothetical protein n=1 Tax=Streptomyces chartreusis TaxID=1969 RepID=UPI0035DC0FB6